MKIFDRQAQAPTTVQLAINATRREHIHKRRLGWLPGNPEIHNRRGGDIRLGDHTIKSWSKTQALLALSTGESTLYATLKASAKTLGIISMLNDYGVKVTGEIWGDAQAALGIIHRKGLGKTRHIQTGLLWVQQVSAETRLKFGKGTG